MSNTAPLLAEADELVQTLAPFADNQRRVALAAFDTHFMPPVSRHLAKLGVEPALSGDVCQMLREKLFVAGSGGRAKIAEYSGRGALASWLRVLAARTLVDVRRKRVEQLADRSGEELTARALPSDPEIAHTKQRYWPVFTAALREALQSLDAEPRELLRLHFVDGLTLEQLVDAAGSVAPPWRVAWRPRARPCWSACSRSGRSAWPCSPRRWIACFASCAASCRSA
jgi:RNA polymerase sigma-70 factor